MFIYFSEFYLLHSVYRSHTLIVKLWSRSNPGLFKFILDQKNLVCHPLLYRMYDF